MLHRLLTLPSQLLEDEDKETMSPVRPGRLCPSPTREEEQEEEEEDGEDKDRKVM